MTDSKNGVGVVYIQPYNPAVGYHPAGYNGSVVSWHGKELGKYVITGKWKWMNNSSSGCNMVSYRVVLTDGSVWHGKHNEDWTQSLRIRKSA